MVLNFAARNLRIPMTKVNGVKHVRVAPYQAASNASAERMVQSFKNHIKAYKGSKLSIQEIIALFLLTYWCDDRVFAHWTSRETYKTG